MFEIPDFDVKMQISLKQMPSADEGVDFSTIMTKSEASWCLFKIPSKEVLLKTQGGPKVFALSLVCSQMPQMFAILELFQEIKMTVDQV